MSTIRPIPEDLTERQADVLEFITNHAASRGYPPTRREICARFGIRSTRGVGRHIEALEKKGYLTRTPKGARAIALSRAPQSRAVPIVGRVAAGRPILAVENIEGTIALDRTVARWKDAFLLKVRGDSMENAGILDGDYVLVKPQASADPQDIVVALIGDEATVKRLIQKDGEIFLKPENPRYEPIRLTSREPVRILGKVAAVFRWPVP